MATSVRLPPEIEKRLDLLATMEDPRSAGKPLTGAMGGFWRYRVGDYRIICEVRDGNLRVLVVRVGNRREVYR